MKYISTFIVLFLSSTIFSQKSVQIGDTVEFTDKVKTEYIFGDIYGKKIKINGEKYLVLKEVYSSALFKVVDPQIAKLKAEAELRKRVERQRIERFYAQVYDKINGELDNIEGIYKSVDQGESFEYDIVIFKSYENNREYVGLILSTTDKDLLVGNKIFTFEKTAQANLFFGKYQTKGGTSYENKTASLNGAILKMGVKSFIKMFPAEGETRQYREINPMVDWQSSGSGVLINNNGFIATNNHVIKGAKKIRISFQNDTADYEAKIISQNEENDVAIVQITDSRFKSAVKPIKWNSSVSLGEKVFTLGYPISNKMSDNVKVVDGIVSGLNGRDGNKAFFQTTLPVWYGNSGGPCFNSKGEILGLATQILWDKGEKVDNVAYITKTSNVLSLANSIITNENISSSGLNEVELQNLIKKLIPYSAFIKVNY
jgi:S1-C subfamily serine protease